MNIQQYRYRLVCVLIGILGGLMTVGDIGCYLSWRCVDILGNFGIWGIGLMISAVVLAIIFEAHERLSQH